MNSLPPLKTLCLQVGWWLHVCVSQRPAPEQANPWLNLVRQAAGFKQGRCSLFEKTTLWFLAHRHNQYLPGPSRSCLWLGNTTPGHRGGIWFHVRLSKVRLCQLWVGASPASVFPSAPSFLLDLNSFLLVSFWHLNATGSDYLTQHLLCPRCRWFTQTSLQTNSLPELHLSRAKRRVYFKNGLAGARWFTTRRGGKKRQTREMQFGSDLNTCAQQPGNEHPAKGSVRCQIV